MKRKCHDIRRIINLLYKSAILDHVGHHEYFIKSIANHQKLFLVDFNLSASSTADLAARPHFFHTTAQWDQIIITRTW